MARMVVIMIVIVTIKMMGYCERFIEYALRREIESLNNERRGKLELANIGEEI